MIDSPEPQFLAQYVIYEDPIDAPGKWIVRRWTIDQDGVHPDHISSSWPSLEAARDAIPDGLYNLGRQIDDDPAIREVWI